MWNLTVTQNLDAGLGITKDRRNTNLDAGLGIAEDWRNAKTDNVRPADTLVLWLSKYYLPRTYYLAPPLGKTCQGHASY